MMIEDSYIYFIIHFKLIIRGRSGCITQIIKVYHLDHLHREFG